MHKRSKKTKAKALIHISNKVKAYDGKSNKSTRLNLMEISMIPMYGMSWKINFNSWNTTAKMSRK